MKANYIVKEHKTIDNIYFRYSIQHIRSIILTSNHLVKGLLYFTASCGWQLPLTNTYFTEDKMIYIFHGE